MRLEGLAGFNQRLQAGEDAGPAIGAVGVGGVVGDPVVMRDGDLGGLGFRQAKLDC